MKFQETGIEGAWLIEPSPIRDERGHFARLLCRDEFAERGLTLDIVQSNVGVSVHVGTLRGLHFQKHPHREVKIVRCCRGSMFDVLVDLRPDSATFRSWYGAELSARNGRTLVVPEGCAQGYLTLEADTEMYYHTTKRYAPDAASGVRYDDPAFGIAWPAEIRVVSDQDRTWPEFVV